MKLRVLIVFLCLFAATRTQAQCNANFIDTSSVCGVFSFTNLSTGTNSLTSFSWTFPSGSPSTSSLQTPPAITYTANGTYTRCLTITNFSPFCTSNICYTVSVNCFSTCVANFNTGTCVPSGTNAQVSFTNTSTGTNSNTSYFWTIGSNTVSNQQHPTITFTANGIYTVCLTYTTTSPSCSATICKTVSIGCVPASTLCAAGFNTLSCTPSGTNASVQFVNTSSGTVAPTSYTWSFGNNSTTNGVNPIATYTANGVYNVCLSITSGSFCTDTICSLITVSCTAPVPTCQANFTNTPCNNGQSTFYSISSGTNSSTTYTWTSTGQPNSPTPTYTVYVCLKMKNNSSSPTNTCSSTLCKTVTINCAEIGFAEYVMENSKVRIFPNPNNGSFTLDLDDVSFNSPIIYLRIYNVLGELVHQTSKEIDNGEFQREVNLGDLTNGAYYLRLSSGNQSYSAKLIISK